MEDNVLKLVPHFCVTIGKVRKKNRLCKVLKKRIFKIYDLDNIDKSRFAQQVHQLVLQAKNYLNFF